MAALDMDMHTAIVWASVGSRQGEVEVGVDNESWTRGTMRRFMEVDRS